MTQNGKPSMAMRFGQWLGHRWRGYLRHEEKALLWLQSLGVPLTVNKVLLWILKASVGIVLLYIAFWITLIFFAAAVGAFTVLNTDSSTCVENTEWRDGLSGFGLYDQAGFRLDPHDPDEMP